MLKIVIAFAFLYVATVATAQELPRRAVFGFAWGPPDAALDANAMPLTVKAVPPSARGQHRGVIAGDVLKSVAGRPVASADDVARALRGHRGGETINLDVTRAGHRVVVRELLRAAPPEQWEGVQVLYRAVPVDGALRRVIVTRPSAAGSHPAILLVGGLGCYSLGKLCTGDH
jgi:hypothetical protein